ncbi:hypothetical protein B484DRAFT_415253 [Ochromonadaceae sp. CCMP2298]|nr:hypothetical protein B484DRAFT_415253 [Ochromonadaceae sp. CCMP2298]
MSSKPPLKGSGKGSGEPASSKKAPGPDAAPKGSKKKGSKKGPASELSEKAVPQSAAAPSPKVAKASPEKPSDLEKVDGDGEEEQLSIGKKLSKYLCCLFCLPKRSRKLKRKLQQSEAKPEEKELPVEYDEAAELLRRRERAATKIQAVGRAALARYLVAEAWKGALSEANTHWREQIRVRNEEQGRKDMATDVRRAFAEQYVFDIFDTSMCFLSQTSEASTVIQKLWRGFKERSARWRPPKLKKKMTFPPPAVPKKSRFSAATLRRVWSRRHFEPENGKWLHTTDFGHLVYDMWEHVHNPPVGNLQGLRTNKVRAFARSEKERQALVGDRHAWVGLPIGISSEHENEMARRQAEPENVARLRSQSPYSSRVVNLDAPEQKLGTKSSRSRKWTGEGAGGMSDVGAVGRPPVPAQQKLMGVKEERSFMQEMEHFGYNPAVMDPVVARGIPPLGALSYDLQTGRRIVHKGRNLWIGVHGTFQVQYDLPEAMQEEESRVGSIESDSFGHPPHLHSFLDGTVKYSNSSLQKDSQFLRDHKSVFLDNFLHHNLSDYSGLHNSTELENHTVQDHSQENHWENNSLSHSLDDETEFNFLLSQQALPQARRGFKESIAAGAAASLSRTITEGRMYPSPGIGMQSSKLVQFTKEGHPIRGARKPTALSSTFSMSIEAFKGRPGSNLGTSRGLGWGERGSLTSDWKSTAWGRLKGKVAGAAIAAASDPMIQSALYSAASGSVFSSQLEEDAGVDSLAEDYNSDEEMWRSRSTYIPKKEVVAKVVVWPKASRQHYQLKYTWIPQPLVHNAVNDLFYEKTVRDYRLQSRVNNNSDFRKDVNQDSERYQKKLEMSSMLSIVSPEVDDTGSVRRFMDAGSVAKSVDSPSAQSVRSDHSHASSVDSSKYYTHFKEQSMPGGSPPFARLDEAGARAGAGAGAGAEAEAQLDNSSLISAANQEETPSSAVSPSLLRGLTFALRGLKGGSTTSAVYDVSPARSVSSHSLASPSLRPQPLSPGTQSPLTIHTERVQERVPLSPDSSPLALSPFSPSPTQGSQFSFDFPEEQSKGPPEQSKGEQSKDPLGATATSSFYSVRSTSKSGAKPPQPKDEFSASFSASARTLAHKEVLIDAQLGGEEKIRSNHFLSKSQRMMHQSSGSGRHVVIRAPPKSPPKDRPPTGPPKVALVPKFKFKPAPPTDDLASLKISAAALKQSSMSSRPPPPQFPPPNVSVKPVSKVKSVRIADPRPGSSELKRADSMHEWDFH